ncbi:MAG: ABC transporter substrate-binding protein [Chitinophagaceae bacterium]|nr:ABC transporter substrate-binding protein [Chitinophagaceae bacterium]MBL0131170.1 ABC transporter substrate-binding protein [Chitinophagaceae bacterium]
MPDFIDQTGRTISLPHIPKRIVSLVPSQTELLADLGLSPEVVGITRFCIHPVAWSGTKTIVGGTKQVKMDVINMLQPDLIIANKEENVKEQVEALEKQFPVWVSDVNKLPDACEMIGQIGLMTNKENAADELISRIKEKFAQRAAAIKKDSILPAAYFIWQNPYMLTGGDTFINSMMDAAGFKNIFADRSRYPIATVEEIRTCNPELLLLSSEPFPFAEKHIYRLQQLFPAAKIILVDGEMFSWYGSRLQYAPAYFARLQEQILQK